MKEAPFYMGLLIAQCVFAVATFVSLWFFTAPYGRHTRKGWGPSLNSTAGWILMESPSALLFALWAWLGTAPWSPPLIVLALMWETHYLHRAFIYPLQRRDAATRMPLIIIATGFLFNATNAYLNGRWLFSFSGSYPSRWLWTARFLGGTTLYLIGYVINRQSDLILRSLRAPGETAYKIPHGGLFRWVSCPNYLGEILEWSGWALATWSWAGLSFAAWTAANLVPRARSHHRWYLAQFSDYPQGRHALLPGIW